jgi:hypothetical protein
MRLSILCYYALVTLLAGIFLPRTADAQTGGGGPTPLTCASNTTSTPTVRFEGQTEAVGDIVVSCTGGQQIPSGGTTPQINLTVSFPTPVTSRLLNGNVSEALLLIDEPNSGLPAPVRGFGSAAAFTLCGTPQTGCQAWAQQVTGTDGNLYEVAVNGPTASAIPANAAPNAYQGLVFGNQVTFFGVPVLPPGPNGSRTFRITNVRFDATQLLGGAGPVQASILTSNPSAVPISNPVPVVATFEPSLVATAAQGQLSACNSQTTQQAAILTYSEAFASAFKTRVDPTVAGQASGQSASLVQNVPGSVYNSESDFTLAIPGSAPAGLADFGTRFKAVFQNVPAGARLFVSLTNLTVDPTTGLATGEAPQPPATDTAHSYAQLTTSETGAFSLATPVAQTAGTNINLVEITPAAGGTATAVWEVVNGQPVSLDKFQFGVFVTYPANMAGSGTVSLSYAPAAESGTVPQFAGGASPSTVINIGACNTLTLSVGSNPAVHGQPVTLTATAPAGSAGSVSFFQSPGTLVAGPVALNGSAAQAAVSLPAGTYSLYAQLAGANSNPVTLVVQKALTVTTLTTPQGRQTLTATVSGIAPGAGSPTGIVQILNPLGQNALNQVIASGTLSPSQGGSTAVFSILAENGYTATYAGDANFSGSSSGSLSLPPAPGGLNCSVNTSNTPTLRSEGNTETAGDIVVTCSNGVTLAPGLPVPQVDVTLTFPVPVTSRLLQGNISEALLLIDEPNSGLPAPVPGFGPLEPFTLCSTPLTGCPAWAQQATVNGQNYPVSVNSPTASADPANAAANVYRGVVGGNVLTFHGVPVLPPLAIASRVFRITNVRLDGSRLGGTSGFTPAQVAILVSDFNTLPITNPMPIVGFTGTSLSTSIATLPAPPVCNTQTLQQAAILNYNEPFASAFKTRVDPTVPGQTSGQSNALLQNRPGFIYNSESDFTLAIPGGAPAGLATFGTRIKAVFNAVPKGARLFVSLSNVTVDSGTGLATGQVPSSNFSYAELVNGETSPFAVPTPTMVVPGTNIQLVEITPSPGNPPPTAVWEVVNTMPTAIEQFQFGVFILYGANPSGGPANVSLSYAPANVPLGNLSPFVPRFRLAQRVAHNFLGTCP